MKIPFKVETVLNKILKPQVVTIVETFIDGKPSKKFYGKSLVANYLQWFYGNMNRSNAAFVDSPAPFSSKYQLLRTDTGALSASVSFNFNPKCDGGAGVITEGIVLGSAVVAPAPASFNVGTIIANGNAINQINYGSNGSSQGVVIAGANSSCKLERTFVNGPTGAITVNAIAIYNSTIVGGAMIYLDSVSPADVIAAGQNYAVSITFQITT